MRIHGRAAGSPAAIRDELLVKVQCADAGDVEAVRAAVVERMEWATAKLARYERIRQRLLGGRSEEAYFAEAERIGRTSLCCAGCRSSGRTSSGATRRCAGSTSAPR